jgi:hypothetical protein
MLPPPDCPFCNHRNPPGAKFCNECGSPLHLAPCEICGAVNNLTDTHCWQCDAALRDPGISAPRPAELKQPSAAEQDEELAQKLAAVGLTPPELDQVPETNRPRTRRVEGVSRHSSIPEPTSLFVQADDAPRSRWHGLMTTVLVAAVGSAIAIGAYVHLHGGTSLETIDPSPASAPDARADAPEEPRPHVAAVPADTPAPTARPESEDRDAPAGPSVAGDAERASAAAPSCPPAVEAMALCERLAHPGRQ